MSSSKSTTASTARSAASTAARLCSLFTGRSGPLSLRTLASVLIATIRKSPLAFASSTSFTCPACSTSKHPLVKTIVPPPSRTPLTSTRSCFSVRTRCPVSVESLRISWCTRSNGIGCTPKTSTSSPAAALANRTESTQPILLARAAARAASIMSPAPVTSYTCLATVGTEIGSLAPRSISSAPCLSSVRTIASASVRARSACASAALWCGCASACVTRPVAFSASVRLGVSAVAPWYLL